MATPRAPSIILKHQQLSSSQNILKKKLAVRYAPQYSLKTKDVVTGGKAMKPDVVCLADVDARRVGWLWEPYIPLRMLSMISGDPGGGKSFIALAIAAGISRGRLPNGQMMEPANTIYLTCENPLAECLRPRFDALGGDPARFFVLKGVRFGEQSEQRSGVITLSNVDVFDQAISEHDARLCVIDPIQSFLGANTDLHRSNETRPVMDGLAKLAESRNCAIALIRHLTKKSGGKAIHRGLGSIDLTGAVRSEMLAGSLADDPQTRALCHIKSNVGRLGNSFGYSIDDEGKFAWTGESTLTAADLLAAPTGRSEDKQTAAEEWLKELLGTGAREQRDIREHAEAAGHSYGTLRRAKDHLGIRPFKAGMQGPWLWALPEDAPSLEDAQ